MTCGFKDHTTELGCTSYWRFCGPKYEEGYFTRIVEKTDTEEIIVYCDIYGIRTQCIF